MVGNLVLYDGSLITRVQDEFAEMEKIFNELFSDSGSLLGFKSGYPKCNLVELEGKFIVEMALAGYDKKDIEIKVEENEVKVSGVKKSQYENAKYHMKELSNRSFAKTITIPKNVNSDKVEAKFNNGVLEITLPKVNKDKDSTRTLEIK